MVIAVGYGAFLAWHEWAYRKSLAPPLSVAATITPPSPPVPLDPAAVATVLGLTAETTLMPSTEPMTLQASFVLGTGLSKALLADAQGSRMYQVGDQLPGGSVLRRVEASRAVLWNKGREEVLTLKTSAGRFLHPFDPQAESQAPAISARYLRPHPGQSE
ncbi:hypothetical protein PS662_05306 [Pseudomonas fluorescens]|uniref:Type II secretion system protein GspC N-terminal domain-containing protein n=2 Tax=Pseudomonas fluorescens TaxID=294 RepID=A0A5E6XC79_PSEFL|nr:hypothetical protein PS662_05306 [Pseudomonas fluorescens]